VISGNPSPTTTDPFGNFVVSFKPPTEIVFSDGEVSFTQVYVQPELTSQSGEIRWAGIFFNPKYQPEKDYDLRAALLHEIGRSLGLAPSAATSSVMYPLKIQSVSKGVLSSDDTAWAGSFYGGDAYAQKTGKISGEVLSGKDSSPWIGAHIQALHFEDQQKFAQTLNRGLFVSGAFSKEKGKFTLVGLPPGNYILLAEADTNMPVPLSFLDAWLKKFSKAEVFETEFYDGAERESNQEAILSFSAQSIYYAASVGVAAGKETTGVSFITNVGDPKTPLIKAKGSTSEVLSKYIPPKQAASSSESDEASPDGSSGGCHLKLDGDFSLASLLSLIFALFLLLQVRRGLKAKSYPVESPKRGRYFR